MNYFLLTLAISILFGFLVICALCIKKEQEKEKIIIEILKKINDILPTKKSKKED